MNPFSRSPRRVLAGFLAMVYFFTNAVLIHALETNIWKERKKTLFANLPASQINKLPQILPTQISGGIPTPSISSLPRFPSKKGHTPNPFLSTIPSSFGSIRAMSGWTGQPHQKILVQIEDVHQNLEAQQNISKTVQALLESGTVNLLTLEGAFEPLNLKALRSYPDQRLVHRLADYSLKENEIAGAIHGLLQSRQGRVETFGIDDKIHHEANVAAYKSTQSQTAKIKKQLSDQRAYVEETKRIKFNQKLYEFDQQVEAYRSGQMELGGYAKLLRDLSDKAVFTLDAFLEAWFLEKSLDFGHVEQERAVLVNELVEKISKESVDQFTQASLAFRSGQIRSAEFYSFFQTLVRKSGVDLVRYPSMRKYFQYVLLSDEISGEKLFSELKELEDDVYSRLVVTDEEKHWVATSKWISLAEKLVDFSLTKEEWGDYAILRTEGMKDLVLRSKGEILRFALNDNLKSFERFYEEADIRDQKMAENILSVMENEKASTAILVAGGYHSSGIRRILNDAGVATVSFTPKISQVSSDSGSNYLTAFAQEKTPLQKLFEGEKLFVAAPPAPQHVLSLSIPARLTTVTESQVPGDRLTSLDQSTFLQAGGRGDFEAETNDTPSGAHATVIGKSGAVEFDYRNTSDGEISFSPSRTKTTLTLSWILFVALLVALEQTLFLHLPLQLVSNGYLPKLLMVAGVGLITLSFLHGPVHRILGEKGLWMESWAVLSRRLLISFGLGGIYFSAGPWGVLAVLLAHIGYDIWRFDRIQNDSSSNALWQPMMLFGRMISNVGMGATKSFSFDDNKDLAVELVYEIVKGKRLILGGEPASSQNLTLQRVSETVHEPIDAVSHLDPAVVRVMMVFLLRHLYRSKEKNKNSISWLIFLINSNLVPFVEQENARSTELFDLGNMDALVRVLNGDGFFLRKGKKVSAQRVKTEWKRPLQTITDFQRFEKIDLVLIANSVINAIRMKQLLNSSEVAAALTREALKAHASPFVHEVQLTRAHPGQIESARIGRELTKGSEFIDSRKGEMQDPYSLRGIPQVHGAVRELSDQVLKNIDRQLIGYLDAKPTNPTSLILSQDQVTMGAAVLGGISERRVYRLNDERLSKGLPDCLVYENPGVNSGTMIAQYTAAAQASAVSNMTSPLMPEASFAAALVSAENAAQVRMRFENILAIELMMAAQGYNLRARPPTSAQPYKAPRLGKGTLAAYRLVRSQVPSLKDDRILSSDIEKISALVHSGQFGEIIQQPLFFVHNEKPVRLETNTSQELNGSNLTIETLRSIAFNPKKNIRPAEQALARLGEERNAVLQQMGYGVNTGVGNFAGVPIKTENDQALMQLKITESHAAGVMNPISIPMARALMLIRANTFLHGHSGVGPQVVLQLFRLLEKGITPVVPSEGSVGASGDLAPLAHMALPLVGEGEVFYQGQRMSAKEALLKAGVDPIVLGPKEGLSLINGTSFSTAFAAVGLLRLESVVARVEAMSPQNALLQSVREALPALRTMIETELNSTTDNPLVVNGTVYSAGNFHGEPMAVVLDTMNILWASVGKVIEQSGIGAKRSENELNLYRLKTLMKPSSSHSIPTAPKDQEDFVSMSARAAVKNEEMATIVETMLGELVGEDDKTRKGDLLEGLRDFIALQPFDSEQQISVKQFAAALEGKRNGANLKSIAQNELRGLFQAGLLQRTQKGRVYEYRLVSWLRNRNGIDEILNPEHSAYLPSLNALRIWRIQDENQLHEAKLATRQLKRKLTTGEYWIAERAGWVIHSLNLGADLFDSEFFSALDRVMGIKKRKRRSAPKVKSIDVKNGVQKIWMDSNKSVRERWENILKFLFHNDESSELKKLLRESLEYDPQQRDMYWSVFNAYLKPELERSFKRRFSGVEAGFGAMISLFLRDRYVDQVFIYQEDLLTFLQYAPVGTLRYFVDQVLVPALLRSKSTAHNSYLARTIRDVAQKRTRQANVAWAGLYRVVTDKKAPIKARAIAAGELSAYLLKKKKSLPHIKMMEDAIEVLRQTLLAPRLTNRGDSDVYQMAATALREIVLSDHLGDMSDAALKVLTEGLLIPDLDKNAASAFIEQLGLFLSLKKDVRIKNKVIRSFERLMEMAQKTGTSLDLEKLEKTVSLSWVHSGAEIDPEIFGFLEKLILVRGLKKRVYENAFNTIVLIGITGGEFSEPVKVLLTRLLTTPNLDPKAIAPLRDTITVLLRTSPFSIDVKDVINGPLQGRSVLTHIIEPLMYKNPEKISLSDVQALVRKFGGVRRCRYALQTLVTRPGIQPEVARAIHKMLFDENAFPLHGPVKQNLLEGPRKVLIVHNINDRRGDALIRTMTLMQSLLDANPQLKITLITGYPSLYGHPRVTALGAENKIKIKKVFDASYDAVVVCYTKRVPMARSLQKQIKNHVAEKKPWMFMMMNNWGRPVFMRFSYSQLKVGGENYAKKTRLNRPRIASVYEPGFRLLHELGLPFSAGEERPRSPSVMVGRPYPSVDRLWSKLVLTKTPEAPIVLLSPFGGFSEKKGYSKNGQLNFEKLAEEITLIVEAGAFVILQPNGTAWGNTEAAESVLNLLSEEIRSSVVVGPELKNGRIMKYLVKKSDAVATVEGGMVHTAFALKKPYVFIQSQGYSGGLDWFPLGQSARQRYVYQLSDVLNVLPEKWTPSSLPFLLLTRVFKFSPDSSWVKVAGMVGALGEAVGIWVVVSNGFELGSLSLVLGLVVLAHTALEMIPVNGQRGSPMDSLHWHTAVFGLYWALSPLYDFHPFAFLIPAAFHFVSDLTRLGWFDWFQLLALNGRIASVVNIPGLQIAMSEPLMMDSRFGTGGGSSERLKIQQELKKKGLNLSDNHIGTLLTAAEKNPIEPKKVNSLLRGVQLRGGQAETICHVFNDAILERPNPPNESDATLEQHMRSRAWVLRHLPDAIDQFLRSQPTQGAESDIVGLFDPHIFGQTIEQLVPSLERVKKIAKEQNRPLYIVKEDGGSPDALFPMMGDPLFGSLVRSIISDPNQSTEEFFSKFIESRNGKAPAKDISEIDRKIHLAVGKIQKYSQTLNKYLTSNPEIKVVKEQINYEGWIPAAKAWLEILEGAEQAAIGNGGAYAQAMYKVPFLFAESIRKRDETVRNQIRELANQPGPKPIFVVLRGFLHHTMFDGDATIGRRFVARTISNDPAYSPPSDWMAYQLLKDPQRELSDAEKKYLLGEGMVRIRSADEDMGKTFFDFFQYLRQFTERIISSETLGQLRKQYPESAARIYTFDSHNKPVLYRGGQSPSSLVYLLFTRVFKFSPDAGWVKIAGMVGALGEAVGIWAVVNNGFELGSLSLVLGLVVLAHTALEMIPVNGQRGSPMKNLPWHAAVFGFYLLLSPFYSFYFVFLIPVLFHLAYDYSLLFLAVDTNNPLGFVSPQWRKEQSRLRDEKFRSSLTPEKMLKALGRHHFARSIRNNFAQQFRLALKGKKSSVSTLKTYARQPTGKEKGKFISINWGGTNATIMQVDLHGDGKYSKGKESNGTLVKFVFGEDHKADPITAFHAIADKIVEMMKGDQTTKVGIGFIFSFPMQQTSLRDGKLVKWVKGWHDPENGEKIIGRDVGQTLNSILKQRGYGNITVNALANDTLNPLVVYNYSDRTRQYVPTMADLGMILGTGHNLASIDLNFEAGAFDGVHSAQNAVDRLMDRLIENPKAGDMLFEKMTSSKYLAELLRVIILEIGKNKNGKYFRWVPGSVFEQPFSLEGADLSLFISTYSNDLNRKRKYFQDKGLAPDSDDLRFLKDLSEALMRRSAHMVAGEIAGTYDVLDPTFRNSHVVAVEGSLYTKNVYYQNALATELGFLLGKKHDRKIYFQSVDGAEGVGAAILAAMDQESEPILTTNTNPASPGAWLALLRWVNIHKISRATGLWLFPVLGVLEGAILGLVLFTGGQIIGAYALLLLLPIGWGIGKIHSYGVASYLDDQNDWLILKRPKFSAGLVQDKEYHDLLADIVRPLKQANALSLVTLLLSFSLVYNTSLITAVSFTAFLHGGANLHRAASAFGVKTTWSLMIIQIFLVGLVLTFVGHWDTHAFVVYFPQLAAVVSEISSYLDGIPLAYPLLGVAVYFFFLVVRLIKNRSISSLGLTATLPLSREEKTSLMDELDEAKDDYFDQFEQTTRWSKMLKIVKRLPLVRQIWPVVGDLGTQELDELIETPLPHWGVTTWFGWLSESIIKWRKDQTLERITSKVSENRLASLSRKIDLFLSNPENRLNKASILNFFDQGGLLQYMEKTNADLLGQPYDPSSASSRDRIADREHRIETLGRLFLFYVGIKYPEEESEIDDEDWDIFSLFQKTISDQDPWVRVAAMRQLQVLGPVFVPRDRRDNVELRVVRHSLKSLVEVDHEPEQVKVAALESLQEFYDDNTLDWALKRFRLKPTSPFVRASLLELMDVILERNESVARSGNSVLYYPIIDELIKTLEDADEYAFVQAQALDGLSKLWNAQQTQIDRLVQFFNTTKEADLKEKALGALASLYATSDLDVSPFLQLLDALVKNSSNNTNLATYAADLHRIFSDWFEIKSDSLTTTVGEAHQQKIELVQNPHSDPFSSEALQFKKELENSGVLVVDLGAYREARRKLGGDSATQQIWLDMERLSNDIEALKVGRPVRLLLPDILDRPISEREARTVVPSATSRVVILGDAFELQLLQTRKVGAAILAAMDQDGGQVEGFIRQDGKNGEATAWRAFGKKYSDARKTNLTDKYWPRIKALVEQALPYISSDITPAVRLAMEKGVSIYGLTSSVHFEDDFVLDLHNRQTKEIFLAKDLMFDLSKSDRGTLVDEYLLHTFLDPFLGHYETIVLCQKVFPDHYSTGDFVSMAGVKYLPGESGHGHKPFKGLLGRKLRQHINFKAQRFRRRTTNTETDSSQFIREVRSTRRQIWGYGFPLRQLTTIKLLLQHAFRVFPENEAAKEKIKAVLQRYTQSVIAFGLTKREQDILWGTKIMGKPIPVLAQQLGLGLIDANRILPGLMQKLSFMTLEKSQATSIAREFKQFRIKTGADEEEWGRILRPTSPVEPRVIRAWENGRRPIPIWAYEKGRDFTRVKFASRTVEKTPEQLEAQRKLSEIIQITNAKFLQVGMWLRPEHPVGRDAVLRWHNGQVAVSAWAIPRLEDLYAAVTDQKRFLDAVESKKPHAWTGLEYDRMAGIYYGTEDFYFEKGKSELLEELWFRMLARQVTQNRSIPLRVPISLDEANSEGVQWNAVKQRLRIQEDYEKLRVSDYFSDKQTDQSLREVRDHLKRGGDVQFFLYRNFLVQALDGQIRQGRIKGWKWVDSKKTSLRKIVNVPPTAQSSPLVLGIVLAFITQNIWPFAVVGAVLIWMYRSVFIVAWKDLNEWLDRWQVELRYPIQLVQTIDGNSKWVWVNPIIISLEKPLFMRGTPASAGSAVPLFPETLNELFSPESYWRPTIRLVHKADDRRAVYDPSMKSSEFMPELEKWLVESGYSEEEFIGIVIAVETVKRQAGFSQDLSKLIIPKFMAQKDFSVQINPHSKNVELLLGNLLTAAYYPHVYTADYFRGATGHELGHVAVANKIVRLKLGQLAPIVSPSLNQFMPAKNLAIGRAEILSDLVTRALIGERGYQGYLLVYAERAPQRISTSVNRGDVSGLKAAINKLTYFLVLLQSVNNSERVEKAIASTIDAIEDLLERGGFEKSAFIALREYYTDVLRNHEWPASQERERDSSVRAHSSPLALGFVLTQMSESIWPLAAGLLILAWMIRPSWNTKEKKTAKRLVVSMAGNEINRLLSETPLDQDVQSIDGRFGSLMRKISPKLGSVKFQSALTMEASRVFGVHRSLFDMMSKLQKLARSLNGAGEIQIYDGPMIVIVNKESNWNADKLVRSVLQKRKGVQQLLFVVETEQLRSQIDSHLTGLPNAWAMTASTPFVLGDDAAPALDLTALQIFLNTQISGFSLHGDSTQVLLPKELVLTNLKIEDGSFWRKAVFHLIDEGLQGTTLTFGSLSTMTTLALLLSRQA